MLKVKFWAVEIEEGRAKLENDGPTKRLSVVVEDGRRKKTKTRDGSYPQAMLSLTKGVVYVGVVLSVKPILKRWQLCLSFKLNVLTT